MTSPTMPRFALGESVKPLGYPVGRVDGRFWTDATVNPQLSPTWSYSVNCNGARYRFREAFLSPVNPDAETAYRQEQAADRNDFAPQSEPVHDPACAHPKCQIPF